MNAGTKITRLNLRAGPRSGPPPGMNVGYAAPGLAYWGMRLPSPHRPVLLSALLITALAVAQIQPAHATGSAWTLLWSDEFSGRAGAQPSEKNWTYDVGNKEQDGWGNHELESYTRSPENVRLDGQGHLELRALKSTAKLQCWNGDACPYTSARLTTLNKVQLTYGKVEARIQVPPGKGYWPAFWALSNGKLSWPNNGELDIMEWLGRDPNTVYGTLHGPGYSGDKGLSAPAALTQPASAGFHTYTLIKRRTEILWLLDGHVYHRVTPQDIPTGTRWVFDQPFYLLLNLAVGGDWPGPVGSETVFPGVMKVDYVRVWKETR